MQLSRRQVLQGTLLSATGIFACSGDSTTTNPAGEQGPATIEVSPSTFPQSVASGDPAPNTVVLWTRVRPNQDREDLRIVLQVALDEDFTQRVMFGDDLERTLLATDERDYCVKVRLTDLEPATTYFYRFLFDTDDARLSSRTGRTRTAPSPDADVPARFAFVSCQDFNGRWYNPYRRLLEEEVDFVVHLGDYIYETTGDPSFQDSSDERNVVFTDLDGAIPTVEDGETFYAARSLDNYRELYRIFRGDAWLQQVHERFPMVVIWDDHEFADDAFGANATATNDREDELDVTRRKNANQAWWEYMPVDLQAGPDFVYDPEAAFPGDLTIYRDLRWGANLHVVLTDLRQYRPNHVIDEGVFPGRVLMDQAQLITELGDVPPFAEPYIDVDTFQGGLYAEALNRAAPLLGFSADDATGRVVLRTIDAAIEALVADGQAAPPAIPTTDDFERGLAAITIGKSGANSSVGSRYLAVREPFNTYANARFAETDGASEDIMGAAQEGWFLDTMRGSDATWKVWGNEFCLIPRVVDVTDFPTLPPSFKQQFLLSVEDWDGAPNKRDQLLEALSDVGNVVAVTGDIHAFFAGTPRSRNDADKRIVEFVTGAVSSGSYERLLIRTAASDPGLREVGAAALALLVEDLLTDPAKATNPHLAFADISRQGMATVEVDAATLRTTFYAIAEEEVRNPIAEDRVMSAFEMTRFEVRAGSPELYREFDGTWRRWDDTAIDWVDA